MYGAAIHICSWIFAVIFILIHIFVIVPFNNNVHIKVKTLTGKVFAFDVENSYTIMNIKYKIKDECGISLNKQRLIFAGKSLCNDQTLKSYNIGNLSTLHLVIRAANIDKSDEINLSRYSCLLFAPLTLKLFESVFLDIQLPSLTFFGPLMKNDIMSPTTIEGIEIIVSLIVSFLMIGFTLNSNFKTLWKNYSSVRFCSTISRILILVILCYTTHNGMDYVIDGFATNKCKILTREVKYENTNTFKIMFKIMFVLMLVLNICIDTVTAIMFVMLLKTYSRMSDVRYSILDGCVKVFVFVAMIPAIKHAKSSSMYSSNGNVVYTHVIGFVIYCMLYIWDYSQRNNYFKIKTV